VPTRRFARAAWRARATALPLIAALSAEIDGAFAEVREFVGKY